MKKLKSILSKVLDIREDEVNDETSPDNVDSWDSFNGLMLVSELENSYDVKFTMEEVVAVKKVRDIKNALGKHGVILENE